MAKAKDCSCRLAAGGQALVELRHAFAEGSGGDPAAPEIHMRGRGQRLGAGPGRDAGGIAEAQRHAGALADDGRNIQAQRARRIEGNAAQQRFALAGVIGQRQGAGRRAGIELETVQPLAGNRRRPARRRRSASGMKVTPV